MNLREFLDDLINREPDELDWLIMELSNPDPDSFVPAICHLSRSNHPEIEQRLFAFLRILDLSNYDSGDNYVIGDRMMFDQIVKVLHRRGLKALPALIQAVSDASEQVRQAAVEVLGESGQADAVEPLYQALSRGEDLLESKIISALGRLDTRAVPLLLRLTEHEDATVRRHTALMLGYRPAESIFEPLIAALRDPIAMVREAAAISLGRLGNKRAVPALLPLLMDASSSVRHFTALALGEIGDPHAVEPLLKALSTDPSLLHGTIVALGELRDSRGYEILVSALTNENESIRICAVRALGKLSDQQAVEPLSAFLLTEQRSSLRQAAVQSLGMLGDQRVIELLITLLKEDPLLASPVAMALGFVGGAQAVETLKYFISEEQRIGLAGWFDACRALKILNESAPSILFMLLEDTEFLHRADVATGLGLIGDRRALPSLEAVLGSPKPVTNSEAFIIPATRQAVVKSLGLIGAGDKNISASLMAVLVNDWDKMVRRNAAEALGQLGDRDAVEALITALKDREAEVRAAAAKALGLLGDPQALPALQILADEDEGFASSNEFVDEIAHEAIVQILYQAKTA